MKFKSLIVMCLALVSLSSFADSEINWLEYEDARALNSDKPIFVFGEMKFCAVCQRMKAEVFNQQEIIDILNEDFLPVKHSSFISGRHKFKDLKDKDGKTLNLVGSPLLMLVEGDNYRYGFGYKSVAQMQKMLESALESKG